MDPVVVEGRLVPHGDWRRFLAEHRLQDVGDEWSVTLAAAASVTTTTSGVHGAGATVTSDVAAVGPLAGCAGDGSVGAGTQPVSATLVSLPVELNA
jgi:hypothetical protein